MSFLPRLQVDALHRRPPSQRKGTSTWLACCAKEAATTRSHLGGLRLKDTGISQTRSLLSPWPSRACCQLCLGRSFEPKLVLLPASPGYAGRLPGLLPLLRGPARGAPPGGMAGLVQLQRGPHLLAIAPGEPHGSEGTSRCLRHSVVPWQGNSFRERRLQKRAIASIIWSCWEFRGHQSSAATWWRSSAGLR